MRLCCLNDWMQKLPCYGCLQEDWSLKLCTNNRDSTIQHSPKVDGARTQTNTLKSCKMRAHIDSGNVHHLNTFAYGVQIRHTLVRWDPLSNANANIRI